MIHAKLEPKHDTIRARLLVAVLALTQPLVRGWSRYFTWLTFKRTRPAVIASRAKNYTPTSRSISELNFWTENGLGREELLPEVIKALETEGWNYSIDTGWKEWDIQVYGSFWWDIRLRSMTEYHDESFWWGIKLRSVKEYHGDAKCLTRIKLDTHMVTTTFLINLLLLAILAYRQFFVPGSDLWLWIPYVVGVGILATRSYRLKRRVARACRHDGATVRIRAHRTEARPTEDLRERVADSIIGRSPRFGASLYAETPRWHDHQPWPPRSIRKIERRTT